MNILLFNNNPVVTKLVTLSAQKTSDNLEVVDSIKNVSSSEYELLVVDDTLYSDELIQEIDAKINFNNSLYICSRDADMIETFDAILKKPFLPTDLVELFARFGKEIQSSATTKKVAPKSESVLDKDDILEVQSLLDETDNQQNNKFDDLSIDDDLAPKEIAFTYNFKEVAKDLSFDTEMLIEFVEDFIAQTKEYKDKLYHSLSQGDFQTLKSESHKLKGVAANLKIIEAFDSLVAVNHSDDTTEVKEELDKLFQVIDKLDTFIHKEQTESIAVPQDDIEDELVIEVAEPSEELSIDFEEDSDTEPLIPLADEDALSLNFDDEDEEELEEVIDDELNLELEDELNLELDDELDDELNLELEDELDDELNLELDDEEELEEVVDDELNIELEDEEELEEVVDDELNLELDDELDDELNLELDDKEELEEVIDDELNLELDDELDDELNLELDDKEELEEVIDDELNLELEDELEDELEEVADEELNLELDDEEELEEVVDDELNLELDDEEELELELEEIAEDELNFDLDESKLELEEITEDETEIQEDEQENNIDNIDLETQIEKAVEELSEDDLASELDEDVLLDMDLDSIDAFDDIDVDEMKLAMGEKPIEKIILSEPKKFQNIEVETKKESNDGVNTLKAVLEALSSEKVVSSLDGMKINISITIGG